MAGAPFRSFPNIGLKTGLPVWVGQFKEDIDKKDPEAIRCLLSVLSAGRAIVLDPVIDFGTITTPGKTLDNTVSNREIKRALDEMKISNLNTVWRSFHMSMKSGPNGQSIGSAMSDLALLPNELIDSIKTLAGKNLATRMDELLYTSFLGVRFLTLWSFIAGSRGSKIRKLSFFGDKEGKTRVIAILDYWSQCALKPLHDSAIESLRRIDTDCTFNQEAFNKSLPSVGPYFSFDLHAATDRIPVALTERMLAKLIGKRKARAWRSILTDYPFSYGQHSVKYAVGQPMGAYSSWPVGLALIHHVLVRISAHRAGISNFNDYCLLGDDIVMTNSSVAFEYQSLMDQIGVEISSTKTHISYNMYEFAKRWFISGQEVTAFAFSGILSNWNRYYLLFNFLNTQGRHGYDLTLENQTRVIGAIYAYFKRTRQLPSVLKKYTLFSVLLTEEGNFTLDSIESIMSKFNLVLPEGIDTVSYAKLVWNSVLLEELKTGAKVAARGFDELNNSIIAKLSGPLAGLVDQTYRDPINEWMDIDAPGFVPVVSALADSRTKFMLSLVDPLGKTNLDLENLVSIVSDTKFFYPKEIFSMRRDHTIALVKAMMGKKFIENWKALSVFEDNRFIYQDFQDLELQSRMVSRMYRPLFADSWDSV
jgi:hypothetical protein